MLAQGFSKNYAIIRNFQKIISDWLQLTLQHN